MISNRDNQVDLTRERLRRTKPAPVAGRIFRRFGLLRIGRPDRSRVEVRQFRARYPLPPEPAA